MSASTWLSGPSRKAAVIRHLPEVLVAIDRSATILWASDSAEPLTGYRGDDLVGRCGLDLVDPLDVETAATALLRTLDSKGVKEPWHLRIVGRDGESRWVEMAPSNLLDDPGIGAVLISIRPLDVRQAMETEARTIEELFRRAFDDAPIGMALMRIDGTFTRANETLCELLRRPQLEILGVDGRTLTHPDDRDVERALLDTLLAGAQRSYELDKRFLLPDGSDLWVCVGVSLVRTPGGDPERFVVHVQDITHRRASEAAVAHQATHDPLTGLANRALFDDRLEVAMARSKRLPTSVAVLCCGIEGIPPGSANLVLTELAARFQEAVRPGDTVARFGAEFVVLCEDMVSDRDLEALTNRLERASARPIRFGDDDVTVGLRIGQALSSGQESAADLLALAEAAMGDA